MGDAQYRAGDGIFIDWSAYALGSERILRGEPLYLPEQLAGPYHLPEMTPEAYIYPPPSAVLFVPFSIGGPGLAAWLAANILLLFSGLAAIVRRESGEVRPRALALALLGLAIVVPLPGHAIAPFPNGVVNANVNVALAGVLAWCWATGAHRRWVPYAAGVGVVIKLFPGAIVLWSARRDGVRPLAIAAGVSAAVVIVTLPFTGIEQWRSFATALANALPTCDDARTSIACLVQPVTGPSGAKVAGIVVGATLLVAAVVVRGEYRGFVLLTLGMLAPVTDGHAHYLLFVYVLVVIAVCRYAARRRSLATDR